MESRLLTKRTSGRQLFWEVTWEGREVEIAAWSEGDDGKSWTEIFETDADARAFVDEATADQRSRGFTEGEQNETVRIDNASNPEIEAYIDQHPDDEEARLVYADWLKDNGDLRGDLITLQHAHRASEASKEAVEELLARHKEQFLGAIADSPEVVVEWGLGFFDHVRIFTATPDGFFDEVSFLRSVLSHPSMRFVRQLIVHHPENGWDYAPYLETMIETGPFRAVRSLQIGLPCQTGRIEIPEGFWQQFPFLEELAIFGRIPTLSTVELPRLETVILRDPQQSVLEQLHHLTGLNRLELDFNNRHLGRSFSSVLSTPLEHLHHLALRGVNAPRRILSQLLESDLLPSLETLELTRFRSVGDWIDLLHDARDRFKHLKKISLDAHLFNAEQERLNRLGLQIVPSPLVHYEAQSWTFEAPGGHEDFHDDEDEYYDDEDGGYSEQGEPSNEDMILLCPYCMDIVENDHGPCPHCAENMDNDAVHEISPEEFDAEATRSCPHCGETIFELAILCPRCRKQENGRVGL